MNTLGLIEIFAFALLVFLLVVVYKFLKLLYKWLKKHSE